MLSSFQIEQLSLNLLEIYREIETELLKNIASRFSASEGKPISGMALWQSEKLMQLGVLNQENIKIIAKYAGKTELEITRTLTEAGYKCLEYDEGLYKKAFEKGLLPNAAGPLTASAGIQQILAAAIGNAKHTFNLVNTTALQSSSKAYIGIVNRAYLETSLGVKSYTEAIRTAVRDLADKGITGITYKDSLGRTYNYQVDAAVRRNIVTSTSQTAGKIQLQRAEEWGSDLVEVSSHLGARPSHAAWQGKIYSRSGKSGKYPDFVSSTGYGTGTGLMGYNCGHVFYPFIEGVSEQTYKPYDEEENARVYKESQQQRTIEREERRLKRRILAADEIGDEKGKLAAQLMLKDKQEELRQFLERTGRTRRRNREQVVGFGRSEASQAAWAVRKAPLPKTAKAPNVVLQSALGDGRIKGIIPEGVILEKVRIIAGAGTSTQLRYVQKLVDEYGGNVLQWQKKGGKITTSTYRYDVHWDEYNGKQYDAKLKGVKPYESKI